MHVHNYFNLPKGQAVKYLKWIDEQIFCFIIADSENKTSSLLDNGSVFHWLPFVANSQPFYAFQLLPQIMSGSIIDYAVSYDKDWHAVTCYINEGTDGKVKKVGKVQLYSWQSKKSQILDSDSVAFVRDGSLNLFVFITKFYLNVVTLDSSFADLSNGKKLMLRSMDIFGSFLHSDVDNKISKLIISPRFNTIFILRWDNYLECVEIQTLCSYLLERCSISCVHADLARDGNLIALSSNGKIIKFVLDQENLVDYVEKNCGNIQAAKNIANAICQNILVEFDQFLQAGKIDEAASLAVSKYGSLFRNQATIEKLQYISNSTGKSFLLFQYFMKILEKSKLNEIESIEFCKIAISQNNMNLIEKLISDDKLTYTEKLGDLCIQNPRIALIIYIRVNVPLKIIVLYAAMGMFDKIYIYCQNYSYRPDWMQIVTIIAQQFPDKIVPVLNFIANKGNPLVDPLMIVQMLQKIQLNKAAIQFIINVLTADRIEDTELQTLLFTMILEDSPEFAKDLFTRNCYSCFKCQRIAALCFERQSPEIWDCVLSPSNIYRKYVIDAVFTKGFPGCKDQAKIFQTIKAFFNAQIPPSLLMESEHFQRNSALQDLFITEAIEYDTTNVMIYVTQFNNYNFDKIFKLLIQAKLYNEAIAECKKFGQNAEAASVMINYKKNIKEAEDFAQICNEPAVWEKVKKAQSHQSANETEIPSKVAPFKVHDPQNIEQNILQYLVDIVENKKLSDGQLLDLFRSTIIENKSTLIEKWKEQKSNAPTVPQNSFQILDINDIKRMIKIETIGRGATSEVYKVSNGQFLAMKTIFIEEDEECTESSNFNKMKKLLQEYELLNMLSHPNIVKTFGVFLGDESNPPSIVLEYCPTNLKKNVKKLTNVECAVIIYQISNAMKKVHAMNIIHRDLKPENILLDNRNQAKLSDFGFSKLMNSQSQMQSQMSFVGTMNFMAPEILLQKEMYDSKVDVFSFGVIVYFILTKGKLPPVNMLDVSKGIKAEIPKNINDFSRDLISKCWNFEPSERPSFEDICEDIIKNKFQLINGIDVNDQIIQKAII